MVIFQANIQTQAAVRKVEDAISVPLKLLFLLNNFLETYSVKARELQCSLLLNFFLTACFDEAIAKYRFYFEAFQHPLKMTAYLHLVGNAKANCS